MHAPRAAPSTLYSMMRSECSGSVRLRLHGAMHQVEPRPQGPRHHSRFRSTPCECACPVGALGPVGRPRGLQRLRPAARVARGRTRSHDLARPPACAARSSPLPETASVAAHCFAANIAHTPFGTHMDDAPDPAELTTSCELVVPPSPLRARPWHVSPSSARTCHRGSAPTGHA